MFQVRDNSIGNIKYAGRSRAVILDNIDPLKKGRVRVDHPLTGETEWIDYLHVPGIFSPPDIGDIVYLEADAGFATHPICWGNISKGVGQPEDLPEEFQRNNPTNRGFYTLGGHLLELDDGEDLIGTKKGIRLTTSDGSKVHIIEDPTSPGLLVELSNGQKFSIDSLTDKASYESVGGAHLDIDGATDKITAEVAFGDKVEISAADGIQASTPAAGGTSLSMKNGKIDITSALDITITSSTGNVTAKASGEATMKLGTAKVGIGSPAGELVDLFEQLLTQLDTLLTDMETETHTGNLGYPTSPPLNAAAYVAVQAQIAIIKGFVTSIKGGI